MMNEALKQRLEDEFSQLGDAKPGIEKIENVYGGSINQSFKLITGGATYFVKTNFAKQFPRMFEKEALGLERLKAARAIEIPEVLAHGEVGDLAYLILSFVDSGQETPDFWESFGQQLAALHQERATHFGLDHDNYIGSLKQRNNNKKSWSTFFIEERLMVQLKLAKDHNLIDTVGMQDFDLLFARLSDYFPDEKPSLLHGDLWSGNFMIDNNGEPLIMDPAIYFGHREMDIGMTKLFGGFQPRFYDAYHESFPMESGWKERIEICNLYPLLVHLNLFGTGYWSSIQNSLRLLI